MVSYTICCVLHISNPFVLCDFIIVSVTKLLIIVMTFTWIDTQIPCSIFFCFLINFFICFTLQNSIFNSFTGISIHLLSQFNCLLIWQLRNFIVFNCLVWHSRNRFYHFNILCTSWYSSNYIRLFSLNWFNEFFGNWILWFVNLNVLQFNWWFTMFFIWF